MTAKSRIITLAGATLSFLLYNSATAQDFKSVKFLHLFGELGNEPGEFLWPSGTDWLGDGRIVIFDDTRIQLCNAAGDCSHFGSEGSEIGQFARDGGTVAIDSEDRIHVADTGNNRVQVCDTTGVCEELAGGEFKRPSSVDIDSMNRVWIGQMLEHRIQVCDGAGVCSAFGEPALLCENGQCSEFSFYQESFWSYPIDIHVDPLNRVFVSRGDYDISNILMCDQADTPVCVELGPRGGGSEPGQFKAPGPMDSDAHGNLYVVDFGNNRLQICQVDPWQCQVIGSPGDGPGQFDQAGDLAVHENKLLSTVEYANRRVQLFTLTDPSPFSVNSGLNGAWYNPDTSGQGFFINVFPQRNLLFMSWFTFETPQRPSEDPPANIGEPYHRWLTAQGGWEGNKATLDVVMTSGGVFDDPTQIVNSAPETYGSITIEFHDCGSATLFYDLFSIGMQGEIPITRIVEDNTRLCDVMPYP